LPKPPSVKPEPSPFLKINLFVIRKLLFKFGPRGTPFFYVTDQASPILQTCPPLCLFTCAFLPDPGLFPGHPPPPPPFLCRFNWIVPSPPCAENLFESLYPARFRFFPFFWVLAGVLLIDLSFTGTGHVPLLPVGAPLSVVTFPPRGQGFPTFSK